MTLPLVTDKMFSHQEELKLRSSLFTMGAGEEYQMYSVKASLSLVPLSNDEMGRYFASYQEIEEKHVNR